MARLTTNDQCEIIAFKNKMIEKLENEKNAKKPHWNTHDIKYLLMRLKEEMKELEEAVFQNKKKCDIIDECLDVYAFSFFIYHKLRG